MRNTLESYVKGEKICYPKNKHSQQHENISTVDGKIEIFFIVLLHFDQKLLQTFPWQNWTVAPSALSSC